MVSDPLLSAERGSALLTKTIRKTLLAHEAARNPHVADFEPPDSEEELPSDAAVRRYRMRVRSRLENTMYDFWAVSHALHWVQGELAGLEEEPSLRSGVVACFAVLFAAVDDTDDFAQLLQEGLELYAREIGTQGMDSYVTIDELSVAFTAHPLDEVRERIGEGDPVPPETALILYQRGELTFGEYLDELERAFRADSDMLKPDEIALLVDEGRVGQEELSR